MERTTYQLPSEFLRRLQKITGKHYTAICATFLTRKQQTFRVNLLKTDASTLRHALRRERIHAKELSYPRGAFILQSDLRALQRSYLYREGHIYVQNVSSMIPPLILEPAPGERILDMCAAPGAKTTQIASLTGPDAQITAIEKIRTRYYKLLANLKIQGADFVKPLLSDAIRVRKKFPEYFDKILLDTPCSAEGRFFVHNPRSYRYWKYRKVKEMAHKQKHLFAAAVYALKPHGILVYSTCTFSPEENEEMVNWALSKFSGQLELMPLTLPLANAVAGLTAWRQMQFCDTMRYTRRILPTESMEGFFIAKLKKV